MDPIQHVFSIPELNKIIQDYAYEPTHYNIWEGDETTLHDCLIKGCPTDIVHYGSNNQLGCATYEIKLDENNEKYLYTVWCADDDWLD